VVALALAFDFVNGFHDAANSIATVVSPRVLRPQWAVVRAAAFNVLAVLFFGLHVATTIGKGAVIPSPVTIPASAAMAAVCWGAFTLCGWR
jgi:PiT family inorganic phosphate transporter